MNKLSTLVAEETYGFDGRWILARFLMGFFPIFVGNRVRTNILRAAGFKIGKGTVFAGAPVLSGGRHSQKRLLIGKNCYISIECYFDLAAAITIGDRAAIGPRSTLITAAHQHGSAIYRAGTLSSAQINICDGAWLGANVLVLPGVTVGSGAIVAAGSVVTRDIPPNTLAAGVPALVKRALSEEQT